MNSLSWLLYAADVSQTIKFGGSMFATFGLVGSVMAYPLSFVAGTTYSFSSPEEKAAAKVRPTQIQKVAKTVAILSVVILALGAVLPSRNTIMLIAASEVGETVLASDQAQKIGGEAGALATDSLKVLRKFINDQLDEAAE